MDRWIRAKNDRGYESSSNLKIEPWLNNKVLSSASSGYSTNQIMDNIYYNFNKKSAVSVEIQLTNATASVSTEEISSGNSFLKRHLQT